MNNPRKRPLSFSPEPQSSKWQKPSPRDGERTGNFNPRKRSFPPTHESPSNKRAKLTELPDDYEDDDGKMTEGQRAVYLACKKGLNVAVVGSAGTGKTFLLGKIAEWLVAQGRTGLVTAMTGNAAHVINTHLKACGLLKEGSSKDEENSSIQARTLHSVLGIHTLRDDMRARDIILAMHGSNWGRPGYRISVIRKLDFFIIDEISMMSAHFFQAIDYLFRFARGKGDVPFGGVQVLVFGDFHQLPPVTSTTVPPAVRVPTTTTGMHLKVALPDDGYGAFPVDDTPRLDAFTFDSISWKVAFSGARGMVRVLTENKRQESHPDFVRFLSMVQKANLDDWGVAYLEALNAKELPASRNRPLTLYCHRANVDQLNTDELAKLTSEKTPKIYDANPMSVVDKKGTVPLRLELKIGAPVMFIANLSYAKNGTLGEVIGYSRVDEFPIVRLYEDDSEHVVNPNVFVGRQDQEFSQIPLKLAYASTVHKVQGHGIERIIFDSSSSRAFAPGQVYVGLSRATNPEGLYIKGLRVADITTHPRVLEFYENHTPKPKLAWPRSMPKPYEQVE